MVAINKDGQLYFTFEDVLEHPVVEEMVSKYILKHREPMRKAFYRVFNRHMAAWSPERVERDYGLKNLVKVSWHGEEECFHVHFKNGDWWHYALTGEWY
ncbi:hypothetical protein [Neobacillus sp. Marseille-QA0830]